MRNEKMPTMNDVGLYRNSFNALDHGGQEEHPIRTMQRMCRILCTVGYTLCAILDELVAARIEREAEDAQG